MTPSVLVLLLSGTTIVVPAPTQPLPVRDGEPLTATPYKDQSTPMTHDRGQDSTEGTVLADGRQRAGQSG